MTRSIRVGYGKHITEIGEKNSNLILLEADLADSTQSEPFQKASPDRYFQIGIAEQNMVGMAAGLSQEGKLPVVNSFAAFNILYVPKIFELINFIGFLIDVSTCDSAAK